MPRASEELNAQWAGDAHARKYLESQGYKIAPPWMWYHPDGKTLDDMTDKEYSALAYLIWEWDWGPLVSPTQVKQ